MGTSSMVRMESCAKQAENQIDNVSEKRVSAQIPIE